MDYVVLRDRKADKKIRSTFKKQENQENATVQSNKKSLGKIPSEQEQNKYMKPKIYGLLGGDIQTYKGVNM